MKHFKCRGKRGIVISCIGVFMAFIVGLSQYQCFCNAFARSEKTDTDINQNTDIQDAGDGNGNPGSMECFLDVRVGFGRKVVIPDPAKTDGKVSISLLSDKDIIKVYERDKRYKKNGDLYLGTDLSFAGFNKPVFVNSYEVGDMTEKSGMVSYISIKNSKGIKKKKVNGSCLVLFVTTKLGEFRSDDENYFVILDYKNGVSYKRKSILPFSASLSLADVTGDGVQELMTSGMCNKSTDFGLYHADKDTHKIKVIYDTDDDGAWIDRAEFKGKLKDNYKVELMVPYIGYSKTVSVIKDGGYKKRWLHNKMEDRDCINYIGMWKKNGKVRKKWAKKHGEVFLYTLNIVSFVKGKDGNMQIQFERPICIGHRSECIGGMDIYMGYDKDLGKLVVKDAKYTKSWGNYT